MSKKKGTKNKSTVIHRWYEQYEKSIKKADEMNRKKLGQTQLTIDSISPERANRRVGKFARRTFLDSKGTEQEMLSELDIQLEVEATLAGQYKGSKKQNLGMKRARAIAAAQSGTLTLSEAMSLKNELIAAGVEGAENLKLNDLRWDRANLSLLYDALKNRGMLSEDAFAYISNNIFNSD